MASEKRTNQITINCPGGHISGKILTPDDYADEMFITIPYDQFALIDLVTVSPNSRRRGKGSRLVRWFIADAKERGAKAVLVEAVNDRGTNAVEGRKAFFESLGFQVFPVEEDEHDSPPLLMIMEISH